MKKQTNKIAFLLLLIINSCTELDLVPLDAPTTAPFISKIQFREGLNEGYRMFHWIKDESGNGVDDDFQRRDALDVIKAGTLNSEDGRAAARWKDKYKGISRLISIKKQIENQNGVLTDKEAKTFLGEANFFIASFWSYLITHYGDVPFFEEELTVDEAFEIGRTNKTEILQKIYDYYDNAITNLPVSYSGLQYATKGAAMAMKARIALYMGDHQIAAEAAQDCMDLKEYALHPNYGELFLSGTKTSDELIFSIPRSDALGVNRNDNLPDFLPRTHGGWGAKQPTWELLASYECVDGLPIDESPLFDPRNPFKNRDPRCLATIVPFGSLEDGDGLLPSDGSNFMNIEYTPHPERLQVFDYNTGEMRFNHDTRSNRTFASYNGLLWKKFIDETWKAPSTAENNHIVIRYADVLLIYAESKIELDEIDASVLAAINKVRDRAYAGSNFSNPVVTTIDQTKLRYIVRNERRAEFANEGLRYMDLIRWRLAEKALTGNTYGMANIGSIIEDVVEPDLWFWGMTPQLDEDGIANFAPLVEAGLARTLNETNFPARQYLWPIPSSDALLNSNLGQNEGY
ncbi:RagB/SusD family nutrient uptake outer membrane protein [Polaribacter batillariae]|uniref:RagB/SusD family nutrient uptake outer membrane protein n=1 Tax=Polaribacter batillariae TaxID=2808900 RepID=A0ABX7SZN5_9FLAO|nr:RagB/SusD family nutrient uptake outer membrane protein [Polaribacter batillariae]QTD38461.1 RagB/SusD family nutrient uptake outer membrane protein [Polaribacter batillariae]